MSACAKAGASLMLSPVMPIGPCRVLHVLDLDQLRFRSRSPLASSIPSCAPMARQWRRCHREHDWRDTQCLQAVIAWRDVFLIVSATAQSPGSACHWPAESPCGPVLRAGAIPLLPQGHTGRAHEPPRSLGRLQRASDFCLLGAAFHGRDSEELCRPATDEADGTAASAARAVSRSRSTLEARHSWSRCRGYKPL